MAASMNEEISNLWFIAQEERSARRGRHLPKLLCVILPSSAVLMNAGLMITERRHEVIRRIGCCHVGV
jgi:hypothetical protein